MAQIPALRGALGRMGFTQNVAHYLTDENQQNLTSLEAFSYLEDDEVENLCKQIRRPGGTIPNPQANVAGQPPTIPNPGLPVSLTAETNLKLMCYFIRYMTRTSTQIEAEHITLAAVRKYRKLKKSEEDHSDAEPPEINAKDWPRTIDSIREYLRGCLGTDKTPLAYVIRSNLDPEEAPHGGFPTFTDELIARAPIRTEVNGNTTYNETYLEDRVLVWNKLDELTRSHECWTYVRPAQRARDGRLAFYGLEDHYLGVNNVDNMSSLAEHRLTTTTYKGELRRWNFEKYVQVHVNQHNILENLVQHGYAGLDERSKVRHLMKGIKTDRLDSVKTRIMSDASLRSDFHACVTLYKDFIAQNISSDLKEVNVSSVNTGSAKSRAASDKEWEDIVPDMTVEDRYYKMSEYKRLSPAKRKGLALMRAKRDKKPKSGGAVSLSKRSIKALASALKDHDGGDTSDTNSSSDADEEVPMKPPAKKAKTIANRTNAALKKKKK